MPKYLTVKEFALIVRRDDTTIRRWIHEKRIDAVKVMDGFLIQETQIQKILRPFEANKAE